MKSVEDSYHNIAIQNTTHYHIDILPRLACCPPFQLCCFGRKKGDSPWPFSFVHLLSMNQLCIFMS